jgi:HTH-type transcriptional regulator/antitoxin HigA
MSSIKPIRSEQDHAAALARIELLMDAEAGTAEAEELDVLADLVEHYEVKHFPIPRPTPIEAIRFRMEQGGLSPRDLVPLFGSRSRVSEVLSGKRPLTLSAARALHEHFGIPAEVLLQQPRPADAQADERVEYKRYPFKEMTRRGWVRDMPRDDEHARELIHQFISRTGCGHLAEARRLFRKNDHARANAKTDPHALAAWCWQVLATANANAPRVTWAEGSVTPAFLREVAQLSWSDDGPRLAQEFLAQHGIPLVVLAHLPRTHLDGAALRLADGRPVVALTLRYDRIDHFWFSLLHELAHVGRHFGAAGSEVFVDDLNLRSTQAAAGDPRELEADEWAEEALIPGEIWATSLVREMPTPAGVEELARALRIHPAIIAGRVRYEQGNYKLLSHYVGSGEVRRHFPGM